MELNTLQIRRLTGIIWRPFDNRVAASPVYCAPLMTLLSLLQSRPFAARGYERTEMYPEMYPALVNIMTSFENLLALVKEAITTSYRIAPGALQIS
eukprot:5474406-Pyramimonas_sp.AAC.2